jgi:putative ABC transport system permease protein
MTMLSNYLRTAVRNMLKRKTGSLIHLVGFSIGIACVLFILLWVRDELSYDRFHDNADDLYRVLLGTGSPTFTPLAQALKDELPEAVEATKYRPIGPRLVKYGENGSHNNRFAVADPAFFEMFSFPFVEGTPSSALADPSSIVITEGMAAKLFGREDPMGKVLNVEDRFDFKVTGVLEDLPANSHIRFDVLAPFPFLNRLWGENLESWDGASHLTYVELKKGSDPKAVGRKISGIVAQHTGDDEIEMRVYPVTGLHLAELPMWLDTPQGSMRYVIVFSAAAVLLLLIACVNFLNLTTARAASRAREVGVRKAAGARQKDLVGQFLFESTFLSSVSLGLAVVAVIVVMPAVNNILGKRMTPALFGAPWIIFGLAALAGLTGLLSGAYPALFISSFPPASALRGAPVSAGRRRFSLRAVLVVAQFVLTIVLLVSASVVGRQLRFIRNHDLGFHKENIITMPATGSLLRRISAAGNELASAPGIESLTLSSTLPGRSETTSSAVTWEGKDPDELIRFETIWADLGFQETFNLTFLTGDYFSRLRLSDLRSGIVVNEAAVRAMELTPETAIGRELMNIPKSSVEGPNGTIIGVVKDFHSRSLHNAIRPLIIRFARTTQDNLSIRIRADRLRETLDFLAGVWAKYSPDYPLDFRFFDDVLDDAYRSEKRMGRLFSVFSLIAVLTSCLGLFGLAANAAERRRKEIGIRKILGASESTIVRLLNREFLAILGAANLIALPAAYAIMKRWLENFAFRTNPGWFVFFISGTLVTLIALGTVAFHSFKAARANPVDSLRYE